MQHQEGFAAQNQFQSRAIHHAVVTCCYFVLRTLKLLYADPGSFIFHGLLVAYLFSVFLLFPVGLQQQVSTAVG